MNSKPRNRLIYGRLTRTSRPLLAGLVAGLVTFAAPAWGQAIHEDLKLLANIGSGNALFGNSIAIDNGIVVVGANLDGDNGIYSGFVYLFDASTGLQIHKLLTSDRERYDFFGKSVAINNGIVAVGAYGDDDSGDHSGSAFLFDASTGALIAKLLAIDGAVEDAFGWSIAIDNGIVAVGAVLDDDNGSSSGSAYLFDASTGAQLQKLLPSDGAEGDWFGYSIAIDNGVVAVGARSDGDNGTDSGSAYLFDASTGAQIAKLLPGDGAADESFGLSIAIDDGLVVVGALAHDNIGFVSGAAYLFDALTGVQIAKLLPDDYVTRIWFGNSVAIGDGFVAVGALRDDDNGFYSGSAYLFNPATGGQIAKLLPSDGATYEYFGSSIAIDRGILAVGARFGDNDDGINSGSAYVFDVNDLSCAADLTGDGILDFWDVSAFLIAYSAQEPAGDFNGDGVFDFFDIAQFFDDYRVGCV